MEITNHSINDYLKNIDKERLKDIVVLVEIMKEITNLEPKMWGSIMGFGNLHYKYKTGTEGNMPLVGLASRKEAITLYLSYDIKSYEELKNLGKYKIGKSCLYIKKLSDINIDVLKSLIIKTSKDTLNSSIVTLNM